MSGACPVHSILRQLDRLIPLAARLGVPPESLPLFPSANGNEVTKHAAVATVFKLVELLGSPTRDSLGCLLYGGHSFRTGGAHLLASRGVNPFKIQSLGRWKSPLVIHYAGESMSSGVASDLRRAAPPDTAIPSDLRLFLDKLDSRLQALELPVLPTDPVGPTASAADALPPPPVSLPIVRNRETGAYHRIAHAAPDATSRRTVCGWHYEQRRFVRANDIVGHPRLGDIPTGTDFRSICPRCLPSEREFAKATQESDDD